MLEHAVIKVLSEQWLVYAQVGGLVTFNRKVFPKHWEYESNERVATVHENFYGKRGLVWHRCAYELLYLLRCFSLTVYCTMCWCWHPFLNLNCCKPFMYSLGLMVEWSSVTVPQMTEMAQGAKCACVKRVKPQLPRTFSWYCTCVAHLSHFFWLFL